MAPCDFMTAHIRNFLAAGTFIFLLSTNIFAQKTITPTRFINDKQGAITPWPVFLLNEKDTTLFGNTPPNIILPEQTSDCGYTFLPENVDDQKYPLHGRKLIYFTGIGTRAVKCYTDANNNFDFTDDGIPETADSTGNISLDINGSSENHEQVRVEFSLLSERVNTKLFPLAIFAQNPYYAGATLLNADKWFSMQTRNIKGNDLVIDGDSLCVAFIDVNHNGQWLDSSDYYFISEYGADSIYTNRYNGALPCADHSLSAYRGITYELLIPDSSGYDLRKRPDLVPPKHLKVGDTVPDFWIHLGNGDSIRFSELREPGKYCYIDFWGTWCSGCRMQIPDLVAMNDSLHDELMLISIAAYDSPAKIMAFTKEKGMNWTQAVMTENVRELFYAGDFFPYGVLIDKDGTIIKFDIDPADVKRIVEKR